jgi:hypothetical protein
VSEFQQPTPILQKKLELGVTANANACTRIALGGCAVLYVRGGLHSTQFLRDAHETNIISSISVIFLSNR